MLLSKRFKLLFQWLQFSKTIQTNNSTYYVVCEILWNLIPYSLNHNLFWKFCPNQWATSQTRFWKPGWKHCGIYVHSLAREVVNVHVEIHRHVVFSTRLIWQAAEVPQGWNVPIVVWHFPHLFCSCGVPGSSTSIAHTNTGDKN